MGDAIIGRRAEDGEYISFREAVQMFATKEELAGMRTGIDAVVQRVGTFVTREEHNARWDRDDEFRRDTKSSLEELKRNRIPERVITLLGIMAAVGIAIWGHH